MSKVLFLISPSLNAFADKRKGTSGNKIDCAFQHYKNSTVSNLQIAAVTGAAGAIGLASIKSDIAAFTKKALADAKAAQAAGKEAVQIAKHPLADLMSSPGGLLKKTKEVYKAVPKPIKIIAGALIALSLLVRTYKKGTIEQKYLDRAQFVDHTYSLDGEGTKASSPLKNSK